MKLWYQVGCVGAPPCEATAAYTPSFSTRMTGFLRSLPLFAPTDVITTIGHSEWPRRVFASVPPDALVGLDLVADPLGRAGLVLALKCHNHPEPDRAVQHSSVHQRTPRIRVTNTEPSTLAANASR